MDEKIVETWIKSQKIDPDTPEFEELSWASDKLIEMAHDEPESLWKIIPEILKRDSSDKILGSLGAGLIEDILIYHGDSFIDRMISFSNENIFFKKAMDFVFLDENDVSAFVYKKFISNKKR